MDAILEAKKRIEVVESALRGKKRKVKILKDDLSMEQLETVYKDEKKMRFLKTEISNLEKDISESLPAQIKAARAAVRQAQQAAKEAEELLPKQKKIVVEIEEASKELLEKLLEAEKANQKLLMLNGGFRAMEAKTQSGLDLEGCSGGFISIKVLIEVLEREIGGEGRVMFIYPPNSRI